MGFLDRVTGGRGEEGDAARAREDDVARIEAGGVPLAAERRLRELAGGGTAFTSELTVPAFALARHADVRPVAQVMGGSVFKIGLQWTPTGGAWGAGAAQELETLSAAWNEARRLALRRLEQEAAMAGAHAVVGVTFDQGRRPALGGELEIVVRGTAVRLAEPPAPGAPPVLSDLSLADFTLLRRGGHAAVGVVAATSVWYVVPDRTTRRLTTGWQAFTANAELRDFTQGVYAARETAIARATAAAARLRAEGLVGVTIEQDVEVREREQGESSKRVDLQVTFHVLGTAIVARGDEQPLSVTPVLRLGAR